MHFDITDQFVKMLEAAAKVSASLPRINAFIADTEKRWHGLGKDKIADLCRRAVEDDITDDEFELFVRRNTALLIGVYEGDSAPFMRAVLGSFPDSISGPLTVEVFRLMDWLMHDVTADITGSFVADIRKDFA